MDSRTQGSRPRAQKKSEAKLKDRPSEDRPSRGQKQECLGKDTKRKCSPKKTGLSSKNSKFSAKLKRFPKKEKIFAQKNRKFSQKKRLSKCFARFLTCSKTNKTNNLWPIFNKSKNMAVLEPRTGQFRELAGFEANAKDFELVYQDSILLLNVAQNLAVQKHD